MEDNTLFETEEATIQKSEAIAGLDIFNGNPLKNDFIWLLDGYKKIYKQIKRLIRINDRQQKKLNQANDALKRISTIDALTGIANRRFFNETFEIECKRSKRDNLPLSLMMIDIDFFKAVNDTHGHEAGDECLKQIARAIKQMVKRPSDLVSRFGGEEFTVLLPNTPPPGSDHIAEAIRKQVEDLVIPFGGVDIKATISIGIVTLDPKSNQNYESMISFADTALYQAKRNGRNQVCAFAV